MKAGWKTVRIGEILDKTENIDPTSFPEREYDYIDVSSVSNKSFSVEETQRIKGKDAPSRARKLVRTNDVLFATIRPTLQRIAIIPRHLDGQICSTGYFVLRPKEVISSRFIYYVLMTDSFRSQMERLQKGASYPAVTDGDVRDQEIPLPPLAEQKRIVALLDEAFAGIDEAKAKARQKLYDAQSITDSHIHSIFTKPGPDWGKKALSELCTFSSGNTPSKSNSGYWNGTIPWISGRDMKSTRLSDSHLHISKSAVEEYGTRVAEPGTLLVLVRGMGLAHGAQVAELTTPCAFNQDIRGIHANAGILPRYLLFALKHGINTSDSVLSSAAHGTLKIDSNELHSLPISFPPLKQQERIVASIDTLTDESQSLVKIFIKQVAALDELRKALLTQAFAGELTA